MNESPDTPRSRSCGCIPRAMQVCCSLSMIFSRQMQTQVGGSSISLSPFLCAVAEGTSAARADFKNVSIVAHYIKERTKNAQFIIISLRNNMFELADRLVGIYKTDNATKSVAINPGAFVVGAPERPPPAIAAS